jgi:hypothetical protein
MVDIMTHIKIFSGATIGGDPGTLEAAINTWLERERPHIAHFAQTALGTDLILSFVFDDETAASSEMLAEETTGVPDIFEQEMGEVELDPTGDATLLPEAELPY